MSTAAILAIAAAVLGAAPLLLRSSAVFMFLSLCTGSLLAKYAAKDVTQVVNSVIAVNAPVYSIVQISLLLAAPLTLLFLYRKRVGVDLVLQLIPAISFAVLMFMMITEMLPYDTQNSILESNIYSLVKPYYSLAIAAGLLGSVFYLWAKRGHSAKHDKKHKK